MIGVTLFGLSSTKVRVKTKNARILAGILWFTRQLVYSNWSTAARLGINEHRDMA